MANIVITDELLALFLEGRTNFEETAAILVAAKKDPFVRSIIKRVIKDGFVGQPKAAPNAFAIPVSKTYALHLLPIERLAASSETNDCVVKCEQYVLKQLDKDAHYEQLYKKASRQHWLQKGGTPLYNIGRLSELAGLSVSKRFRGTLTDIQQELESGCFVIAALNAARLKSPNARGATACDHAVVVTGVDQENNQVQFYDPQAIETVDICPTSTFIKAWKTSKNFFVSIVERGVRPYVPHPEYVAHIKLPEELVTLVDNLAENAHEVWATKRIAEAQKKGKAAVDKLYREDPFMKPFIELTKQQRKTDYTTAIHSIKLLYKLGFTISPIKTISLKFYPTLRDADGHYTPKPIPVDKVTLPPEIEQLTEYIAENAHEEWAKQRIKEGWTYAEKKDKKLKQTPDLVPYCELLDSEKAYDRRMAMNTIRALYKIGYIITKNR